MLWYGLYGLLAAEVAVLTLLVLPLPLALQAALLRPMRMLWNAAPFRAVMIGVAVVVLVIGIASYQENNALYHKRHAPNLAEGQLEALNVRYFRGQRNVYLCFLSDYLLLMLFGFNNLFQEIADLRKRVSVGKKTK
eukprot:RCo041150